LATGALLLTCCTTAPPAGAAPPLAFGVLGASCEASRVAAERQAGIATVELPVAWDKFEPQSDTYSPSYIDQLRAKIDVCHQAGLEIVLSPGLQYPPDWVRSLPGGTYLGQTGHAPKHGEIDVVFSQAVRQAVASYYQHLGTDIGFGSIAAIRLGTDSTGEFGYPGPNAAGGSHEFWAFSPAAQNGTGLATGLAPSPMPGWVPGQTQFNGHPVTVADASKWFDWYTNSLVNAVTFQLDQLRGLGFGGRFELPIAGRGVLPQDLHSALQGRLDGRADPDGAIERGLNYPAQFTRFAQLDAQLRAKNRLQRIEIDFTGLDDDTAVQARTRTPPQDRCHAGDTTNLLARPGTDTWSAQRWTIANAQRVNLAVIGENPGPPDAPNTGGSRRSDTSAQQLTHAVSYARGCGLNRFLWAFEDELFTDGSGVDLNQYAQQISTPAGR
jgi:hypothetical protein